MKEKAREDRITMACWRPSVPELLSIRNSGCCTVRPLSPSGKGLFRPGFGKYTLKMYKGQIRGHAAATTTPASDDVKQQE